jgi:hypothetical protein
MLEVPALTALHLVCHPVWTSHFKFKPPFWVNLGRRLVGHCRQLLRFNVGNGQQPALPSDGQMTQDRVAGASLRTVVMSNE